jgi:hypothetical protein
MASERFAAFADINWSNAVPHHNTVFHAVLKHVPWAKFDRLVAEHDADAQVRCFSTKQQFIALLYGQLARVTSLRAIVAELQSHAAPLYHVGAGEVHRSTFADANAKRPYQVFTELLGFLMAHAHRGLLRKLADLVYLIDSTSLRLSGLSADWARFSANAVGVKLHVVYDPHADRPIYAVMTTANFNDITAAQAMPITPGATYVFDLAYYDYAWWAKLDAEGCRIVTRFKSNTPLSVVAEQPVAKGGNILSDRIGHLPARQSRSRRNPFEDPVREVRVKTETGKVLRILCNDLDATAEEIAELYKRRWAIELFFGWVKQTLRITRFLGTSENAIRIQIAVALIALLLLRLAQATQHAVASPLAFARLVTANLMHQIFFTFFLLLFHSHTGTMESDSPTPR